MGGRADGESGKNHLLVRFCVIYRTVICSISEGWEDRRRKEKDGLDGSNNTDRGINVGPRVEEKQQRKEVQGQTEQQRRAEEEKEHCSVEAEKRREAEQQQK